MNFKWLLTLFLLLVSLSSSAQNSMDRPSDSLFQPKRLFGIGLTPISTLNVPTFSVELGYTLTRKLQVFGGPQFYTTNYGPYPTASTLGFGSFYGGFGGFRGWWRGIPNQGWAYFSSLELHLFMDQIGRTAFFRPYERIILGPEIGNGFGRFSQKGFFFLFNFNWGPEILIKGQARGDVYGSLRFATGIRF